MPPFRRPGPLGSETNPPTFDGQTGARVRVAPPASVCASNDPELFDRVGYLRDALSMAFSEYAEESVKRHTTDDFVELFRLLLPGLLVALLAIVTTSALGAGLGAALGAGAGAGVGAWLGAKAGLVLLEFLGIAFLVVYIAEHLDEVRQHFARGAELAWGSCGDPGDVRRAAREFAEGVGVFASLVIQAILLYLVNAAAQRVTRAALSALRNTRLFRSLRGLEAWLNENFIRLCFRYKIRSGIQVIQGGAPALAVPRYQALLGQARGLLKDVLGGGDAPRFRSFRELHEFLLQRGFAVIEKGPKAADPAGVPFGTGRYGPRDAAGHVVRDAAQVIYANADRSLIIKVKTRGYPDGKRANGTLSLEVTDGQGTGWPNTLFKVDRNGGVVAKALRGSDDVVALARTTTGPDGQEIQAVYYATRNGMKKLDSGASLETLSVERGELVSPFELLEGGKVQPMDQTLFNDRGHIDFGPGFDRTGVWKILGLE